MTRSGKLFFEAVQKLRSRNEILCFTPQVLSEFWNVCTRPASARDGLGLSTTQTDRKARLVERYFRLLHDSLVTFQQWRRIVVAHSVMGVEVDDAKLVASMNVYGLTHLVTFNLTDFKRYPAITHISPVEVKRL
ncbi:MAG TPA: type II toxin-antitoxin system VapC family toxin [Blastocatellia bacterium]|nr:type II toxin-antitoxin system VapC family toxin [Blastocatellia bacterium]